MSLLLKLKEYLIAPNENLYQIIQIAEDFIVEDLVLTTRSDNADVLIFYVSLFLSYYTSGETSKASYLWKSCPPALQNNAYLLDIWKIGQTLRRRNFSHLLSSFPPNEIPELRPLYELARQSCTDLIRRQLQAYQVISIGTAQSFLSLDREETIAECLSSGWQLDGEYLVQHTPPPSSSCIQPHQFQKLPSYISFLEQN